jgi:hypothetical protein
VKRAALVLVALALTGCETTAERSAKLERLAKQEAGHGAPGLKGLSIARESTDARVVGASVVRSSEGAAAVVTLRNVSSHALRALPIAIAVKDAGGRTLFQNNAPGLEAGLVSVSLLAPHAELTWVDDQLPASGAPATVAARVGQATTVAGKLPKIAIERLHVIEDPSNGVGATGILSNRSPIQQRKLVVFVVARRAGRIIAAARAVLPEVPAGSSMPFQTFFIGDPRGAQLQASAPPTTLG